MEFRLARLQLSVERYERLPNTTRAWAQAFHDWGLSRGPQEVGWVMSFDADKNVHTIVEIARGTNRSLPIHFPTLLGAVLVSGTDRFVFIHSHPGSDPTPSRLDIELTQQIADAAAMCGLYFEDHFIVTKDPNRYTSLTKEGHYVPPKYIETIATRPAAASHTKVLYGCP